MRAARQPAEFVAARRQEAWAFSRALREDLLRCYAREYGSSLPLPPAAIVDELIRDILGYQLRYDPLPPDVFAKTTWHGDITCITVNSLTGEIPGVKDAAGVQNVAKWHEIVHGVADRPGGCSGQMALAGFDLPRQIACYRAGRGVQNAGTLAREFWAEEAGRAAAVSYPHLFRSEAFREFCAGGWSNRRGWRLLYESARALAVNITALVTQLELEGWITVRRERGRAELVLQPRLLEVLPR